MREIKIHTIDALRDAEALAEILSTGAVFPLVVTGSSMMPFLKEGRDTVRLRQTDQLHRGKIIFFRRKNGEFVLHRIRRIYPDGRLLVNGDAQKWCESVCRDQVLAEVISISRDGREILPDSMRSRILRALWYPTRIFRPLIWRTYAFLRRTAKKK